MKPTIIALTIAAVLFSVSLAGVALYAGAGDQLDASATHAQAGANEEALHGGWAGDGHHNGDAGMERPSFPEAQGTTPTAESATALEQVSRLQIRTEEDFTPANGVRSGTGTLSDPYVISGYYVTGDLFLADTDSCVVVKENYIGGQLTLNWNAQCVHVHHNHVRDLRVNENVRRTGYATGGLLELNTIEYIGQIRHYDGEFRNNVVGPFDPQDIFEPVAETVPWLFGTDPRVANVDGFNQGNFHHNTFYGSVDLDLHGHHHGTGFFAPHSHYHGGDMDRGMMHDHSLRWTSVAFTDNKIVAVSDDDYGLRYDDRNHAGDDRTATSEEEETLSLDHRHWTHIVIDGNEIQDAQIWVDVFNADDQNHYAENPGWLEVTNNDVTFQARNEEGIYGTPFFGSGTDWTSAIHINTAKEVDLRVVGNSVAFKEAPPTGGMDLYPFDDNVEIRYAAISLNGIKSASIELSNNVFDGFYYGIEAANMADSVQWTVAGNDFGGAQYPVYYDESVKSAPIGSDIQQDDEAAEESDGHEDHNHG